MRQQAQERRPPPRPQSQPLAVETTVLQSIQRAEIDSTIATAKNFPRDITRALERCEEMVTMTPAIAESTHYSLPRKDKNGRQVNIQGPSIRFAEILASQWGNLRIASRVIDVGAKQVVAQGVCLDLETNVAYDVEVRKSIVTKDGRRYSDDVITTNANASAAIAQRNAVLKAIPRPLWQPLYEAALACIGAEKTPLSERWQRAVTWFASRGIIEARLMKALGMIKRGDISKETMLQLTGWRNAIEQDADALEEIFGTEQAPAEPAPAPAAKPGRKRKAASEVNATTVGAPAVKVVEPDPEPEPQATDDEAMDDFRSDTETPEVKAFKNTLLNELRDHCKVMPEAHVKEVRAAAGVELFNMKCTVAQLEAGVHKAEEIVTGERE